MATELTFKTIRTSEGFVSLAWTERGLKKTTFPRATAKEAEVDLREKDVKIKKLKGAAPKWLSVFQEVLSAQLTEDIKIRKLKNPPLDFSDLPETWQRIFSYVLAIPRGHAVTTSQLAKELSLSEKEVKEAMSKNPMPLLIPCHRVLEAKGKVGQSLTQGGMDAKLRLLELEGFQLSTVTLSKKIDIDQVIRYLSKRDPKLGKLIRRLGPFELKILEKADPFEYLLRSILFQQLNGRAASTIHERLRSLYGGRDPSATELLATSSEELSRVGVSRQKQAAFMDLAKAKLEGRVPSRKEMRELRDEEIIEMLTSVRGVGRWTVEMLLLFALGRSDILALDDFAIKKATMILHGLDEMPKRQTLSNIGKLWKPWRSVASWYLWRSLD